MPKSGFKSITIGEDIYEKFNASFLENKDTLAVNGIRSLSGYLSYILESRMVEAEALSDYNPVIKKISVEKDHIILLDNGFNRIAEVVVRDGEMYCQLCEEYSCLHAGFAYALPEAGALLDT